MESRAGFFCVAQIRIPKMKPSRPNISTGWRDLLRGLKAMFEDF